MNMPSKTIKNSNDRVDSSEQTTLRLSDDIGKMADRIGGMADRIGEMAERILKTQEIQAKNIELTQKSMLELMQAMTKQMEFSNRLMELMFDKGDNVPGKQLPSWQLSKSTEPAKKSE
jgi:TolA-binding protein